MNNRKLYFLSLIGFFFALLISQNASFSQSMKNQIETLNFKIDSANQVISIERNNQKNSISYLEFQESKLKQKVDSLMKEIKSIENQINDQQNKKQIIESEISRLKKEIQTLLIGIFHQKIIGTYSIPNFDGTCITNYKLYIDKNLKISFITTCLLPESKDENNVGTFELNKPIKFKGPYFNGFLFKENGFYLLDEEDNILSISNCCENDSKNTCECMISYTSKIVEL